MANESLAEVVQSLTPQEQDAVRQFVDYLKNRHASLQSESPFLRAADEFIAQHRPVLPGAGGAYLFPAAEGGPRSDKAMRTAVSSAPIVSSSGVVGSTRCE